MTTYFMRHPLFMDTNWKLGLIGRNGKGKTTLLRLLMGQYSYRGSISSSVLFDYFPFQIQKEDMERDTIEVIERIQPDYELWRSAGNWNFCIWRRYSLPSVSDAEPRRAHKGQLAVHFFPGKIIFCSLMSRRITWIWRPESCCVRT